MNFFPGYRSLQDNGNNATFAPTDMNRDNGSEQSTSTQDDSSQDNEGMTFWGVVALAAFLVIMVFVGWKAIQYWKMRRERYMLQVQSNRADAVLGDMQMVPNDDEYDEDDPELL